MPQGTLIPESPVSPSMITGIPSQGRTEQGDHGTTLSRDSIHTVERDGLMCLISENYSYKSEAYYTILEREIRGQAHNSHHVIHPRCLCRAYLPRTGAP